LLVDSKAALSNGKKGRRDLGGLSRNQRGSLTHLLPFKEESLCERGRMTAHRVTPNGHVRDAQSNGESQRTGLSTPALERLDTRTHKNQQGAIGTEKGK